MAENRKNDKKGFVIDAVPRIVCVFVAIIIWLYAVYNSNPNYEKRFDGIEVTPLFSDMLDDRGLALYGSIDETVEVVIYGKRGNITAYSKEDVRATASLIGVSEAGEHIIGINVEALEGATVKSYFPKEITVTVEELAVKEVPVIAAPSYTTAYSSGEAVVSVSVATVKGPRAELEFVDHVEARPTFEKALTTSMVAVGVPLVACTKDGSAIDSAYIGIEPSQAEVEIPIYDEREIPITVEQKNSEFAQIIDSLSVYPNVINVRHKISGGKTLDGVESLVVGEFDETNLSGLSRNEKLVLPITLPSGYEKLSDFEAVTVNVGYDSTTTSAVFKCSKFKLDNPEKLQYSMKTEALDVCVRLPVSLASSISFDGFTFEGSLADVEDGRIPVTVNVPDEYEGQIYVIGSYFAEASVK